MHFTICDTYSIVGEVEVSHKTRHLRNINPTSKKVCSLCRNQSLCLPYIFDETNPFEMDRCKSKTGASVEGALALINCTMQLRWINSMHHAFKVRFSLTDLQDI